MSLKIAVFGTSRSGKDYTIHDATELLAEEGILLTHLSPIGMVHGELGGRSLRNMSNSEKNDVISTVRNRINDLLQDGYVIVDEHYCFPETFGGRKIDNGYYGEKLPYRVEQNKGGNRYETVFEARWIKKYDLIIYLDIDPVTILDRFHSSEGDKKNLFATYEDISLWQIFEMERLEDLCNNYHIPMYYVYDPKKSGEELATIISRHLKTIGSGTRTKTRN